MSDSGETPRPEDGRFVLAPQPPVRSLAISAAAAVIAAAMIVFGSALHLAQVVVVVGMALMIFAIALAVVALLLTARLRTTLILDPRSITIVQGRRCRRTVPWSSIESVKMQGPRLLLITRPEHGPDASVINPSGNTATFTALTAQVRQHLNADRGYRRIS